MSEPATTNKAKRIAIIPGDGIGKEVTREAVKVLEALGAGKAVVATPLAAEGIDVPSGEGILLAETDAEFADCVLLLLRDEQRRRAIATAAYIWAREHLRWDAAAAQYEQLYAELLA